MTEPPIDYGTPLAGDDDVRLALGRALTDSETERLPGILAKASELFRLEAGQTFTPGRSDVRLKVNAECVHLPQSPAGVIHSVTDDHGRAVAYTRRKQWLHIRRGSHEFVTVDYSHGDEAVPVLVRLTIAEIAKKVLSINPNAAAGVVQHQETSGPFSDSDTYATWAQGGQTLLAPDDLAIARRYRTRVPRLWVQRA